MGGPYKQWNYDISLANPNRIMSNVTNLLVIEAIIHKYISWQFFILWPNISENITILMFMVLEAYLNNV